MSKNDGGSAFPTFSTSQEGRMYQCHDGMTLRDWFAGQAMSKVEISLAVQVQHELVNLTGNYDIATYRKFIGEQAKLAYAYADAMLAAREAH